MVQGLVQIFRIDLTINIHISEFRGRFLGRVRYIFNSLYLLICVRELSDMLQNDVKNPRLKKLVELLPDFFEIANWAVEDKEALLDLAQNFWEVFDSLLVGLRIICGHAHADVWHERQHVGIEIALTKAMASDFLHDLEYPLLSSKLKEIHLL